MAHIHILHRPGHLPANFLIAVLSRFWKREGHTVTTSRDFAGDADLCLLHVNLTQVPLDLVAQAPAGQLILNRHVTDISKRRISTNLLQPDDDWDGPVILKTNANHFGRPEQVGVVPTLQQQARRAVARHFWSLARQLPSGRYPVLPRLRAVPGWVWRRPDLVVERFLPERHGDLFCLRGWQFFGDAGYGYRLWATDPFVKTATMVRYDYDEEPPPAIRARRAELRFDFGKFDYVMRDGEAVLFDTNKTPALSGTQETPRTLMLAAAVERFL